MIDHYHHQVTLHVCAFVAGKNKGHFRECEYIISKIILPLQQYYVQDALFIIIIIVTVGLFFVRIS